MPVSAKELFHWHEKQGAFHRLSPPWDQVKVLRQDPTLKPGAEVHIQMKMGPFPLKWVAKHTEYHPPNEFVDIQLKGPFKKWIHRHRMFELGELTSELEDHITFQTPWSLGEGMALKSVERLFNYRHEVLKNDLTVQQTTPSQPLNIAMTGSSGMVGSALTAFLQTAGHRVIPIGRHRIQGGEIIWDPASQTIETEKLENLDAVIHLAGENIGSGRWTAAKKMRIYNSRIQGTRLLVNTLNSLKVPPKVFVSASAVGYYGRSIDTPCDETADSGKDFLASVCVDWEKEASRFESGRCVTPRLGVVISSSGGALQQMLTPFRLGLGGVIGSGKQLLSWIALDDLVYSLYRLVVDENFSGPVNLCTPNPITNYELTKTLGKILRRPTMLPLPSFAARAAFGEMADATILSSCQAEPKKLIENRHAFYFPKIEDALRHTLGKRC